MRKQNGIQLQGALSPWGFCAEDYSYLPRNRAVLLTIAQVLVIYAVMPCLRPDSFMLSDFTKIFWFIFFK